MKKRSVVTVINDICRIAPELSEPLEDKLAYTAPELLWTKVTEFINHNVVADPDDPHAVAIYAALMGISNRRMRKMMRERERRT